MIVIKSGTSLTNNFSAWGVLAGLFLLSAGFIGYVMAPASILPLFMADFSVQKPAASASISAVFLTWALLQIPGGFIMDRYENQRLVGLGSVVFFLAAIGGLLTGHYELFLLTRLVSGACVVFIFIGSVNILNTLLPDPHQALGIGLFVASPPFGIAIAQFSGPRIAEPLGWRVALLAYVLLAVFGFLLFWALLPRSVVETKRATVSQFIAALQNPSVLLISLASFCTYFVWTFLNSWMPTYGTEVLGIDLSAAGAASALVPLAGMVSRPGGGWLTNLFGGRLRPVIVASFLASMFFLSLLALAPSPVVFAALLALTGGAVNLAVGLYLVYVHRLSDDATRGTSMALLLTFSQIGNLVAPVAGGWLIARVSWTAGFGSAVGLGLAGLLVIMLVPPAD